MIANVKGGFSDLSGSILIDEQTPTNSKVEVEIDTASIDTRDEKRDEHLRSPDFFNSEQYPIIRFVSTSVEGFDGDEFDLVGDLTIGGVAKPVTIKAERTGTGVSPWGATVTGFEGETRINRKDFGLNWNTALEAGGFLVGDEVKIQLNVEAIQQ